MIEIMFCNIDTLLQNQKHCMLIRELQKQTVADLSLGTHMAQHMNGVKVGATTVFLNILANGCHICHAPWLGAHSKLHGFLQILGVSITGGNGQHDLHLCLLLGNSMGRVQGCLDQLWQIWEDFFHLGHNDVPWPSIHAHGMERALGSMGATACLEVQGPIAANGCQFLIGSGAAMENSLAKLGDMAAPKGKVPFMATWWAKGAFCQFDHGLVGFNLVLLGLLLVGNFNGHTGLDLLQIWSNGKDHGTFLVAVMVGQHGPTSVLGVHQELGWLQGLLVQQTILLELVLDLLPLGPDGQHGVILDLGDGFLELLVHGSNQEAEDMDNGDTCMSCLAWSTILLPACLPSWRLHGLACILHGCESHWSFGCGSHMEQPTERQLIEKHCVLKQKNTCLHASCSC